MAFVKFSRGYLSKYESLTTKDADTLYLVYTPDDPDKGQLYLGDRLISSPGISSISLSDLTDISIEGTPTEGMILQYNTSTNPDGGAWEAVPLADVIPDKISIQDSLPSGNDITENTLAVVDDNVYIYNGEDWEQLTDSRLADRLTNLETAVGHSSAEGIPATGLYSELETLRNNTYTKTEVNNLILNASHLRYEIVDDISRIDVTDIESVDNVVFLVAKDSEDNIDGYDEYFVINKKLEKIGSWDVDLSNYVEKDDSHLLSDDDIKKLQGLSLDEHDQTQIQPSQVANLEEFIKAHGKIVKVQPDTFEIVNGELQLKSVPSIDLSGYVKTETFNDTVGNLDDILGGRAASDSTLVQEINKIKESIIWDELNNNI